MNDYFHYDEEEFYSQDRKFHRKERKLASAKDRSKFKKSDQDQIKKREQPLSPEELTNAQRGRVLSIKPEGILVDSEGKQFQCTLKGSLKQEKNRLKNLVAIGDFVHIVANGEQATIVQIEERKSILSRADNLSRNKEQLIAVNIDQVLITASVLLPSLKPSLIDRYIIAAKKGNMQPIIVVNKIDLLHAPPSFLNSDEIEEEINLYHEFIQIYKSLGILIFPVSSATGEGIEELKKAMENKSSVFSGQSGVGKSSLINAALGTKLDVGDIVEKTQKGSHTTTSSHLIPLESGGFCIDTPGIKSFGIWEMEKNEIQEYFSEIQSYSSCCKYPDCSHLQEPECAVQKAVEDNEISSLRFGSYCALMNSLGEVHRPR